MQILIQYYSDVVLIATNKNKNVCFKIFKGIKIDELEFGLRYGAYTVYAFAIPNVSRLHLLRYSVVGQTWLGKAGSWRSCCQLLAAACSTHTQFWFIILIPVTLLPARMQPGRATTLPPATSLYPQLGRRRSIPLFLFTRFLVLLLQLLHVLLVFPPSLPYPVNGWHSSRFNIFLPHLSSFRFTDLIYHVCRHFVDFCCPTFWNIGLAIGARLKGALRRSK